MHHPVDGVLRTAPAPSVSVTVFPAVFVGSQPHEQPGQLLPTRLQLPGSEHPEERRGARPGGGAMFAFACCDCRKDDDWTT